MAAPEKYDISDKGNYNLLINKLRQVYKDYRPGQTAFGAQIKLGDVELTLWFNPANLYMYYASLPDDNTKIVSFELGLEADKAAKPSTTGKDNEFYSNNMRVTYERFPDDWSFGKDRFRDSLTTYRKYVENRIKAGPRGNFKLEGGDRRAVSYLANMTAEAARFEYIRRGVYDAWSDGQKWEVIKTNSSFEEDITSWSKTRKLTTQELEMKYGVGSLKFEPSRSQLNAMCS
ncbi:hypothetical protein ACIP5Y_06980 [Nocardia sp. NPDC088792]|uniref:hypothetical protein n=1 Tax=Nocardia sp. NPDC088792 TaxID=3364332 RepID=UPI00381C849B